VRASTEEHDRRRRAIDWEPVHKESKRESGGLPVKVDMVLLRPRLLPLSAEQEAEAVVVVVLSELLLAEAHRSASSRNVSTHGVEGSPSRGEFAAGELAREGLAA
jgi:hypothetical protein